MALTILSADRGIIKTNLARLLQRDQEEFSNMLRIVSDWRDPTKDQVRQAKNALMRIGLSAANVQEGTIGDIIDSTFVRARRENDEIPGIDKAYQGLTRSEDAVLLQYFVDYFPKDKVGAHIDMATAVVAESAALSFSDKSYGSFSEQLSTMFRHRGSLGEFLFVENLTEIARLYRSLYNEMYGNWRNPVQPHYSHYFQPKPEFEHAAEVFMDTFENSKLLDLIKLLDTKTHAKMLSVIDAYVSRLEVEPDKADLRKFLLDPMNLFKVKGDDPDFNFWEHHAYMQEQREMTSRRSASRLKAITTQQSRLTVVSLETYRQATDLVPDLDAIALISAVRSDNKSARIALGLRNRLSAESAEYTASPSFMIEQLEEVTAYLRSIEAHLPRIFANDAYPIKDVNALVSYSSQFEDIEMLAIQACGQVSYHSSYRILSRAHNLKQKISEKAELYRRYCESLEPRVVRTLESKQWNTKQDIDGLEAGIESEVDSALKGSRVFLRQNIKGLARAKAAIVKAKEEYAVQLERRKVELSDLKDSIDLYVSSIGTISVNHISLADARKLDALRDLYSGYQQLLEPFRADAALHNLFIECESRLSGWSWALKHSDIRLALSAELDKTNNYAKSALERYSQDIPQLEAYRKRCDELALIIPIIAHDLGVGSLTKSAERIDSLIVGVRTTFNERKEILSKRPADIDKLEADIDQAIKAGEVDTLYDTHLSTLVEYAVECSQWGQDQGLAEEASAIQDRCRALMSSTSAHLQDESSSNQEYVGRLKDRIDFIKPLSVNNRNELEESIARLDELEQDARLFGTWDGSTDATVAKIDGARTQAKDKIASYDAQYESRSTELDDRNTRLQERLTAIGDFSVPGCVIDIHDVDNPDFYGLVEAYKTYQDALSFSETCDDWQSDSALDESIKTHESLVSSLKLAIIEVENKLGEYIETLYEKLDSYSEKTLQTQQEADDLNSERVNLEMAVRSANALPKYGAFSLESDARLKKVSDNLDRVSSNVGEMVKEYARKKEIASNHIKGLSDEIGAYYLESPINGDKDTGYRKHCSWAEIVDGQISDFLERCGAYNPFSGEKRDDGLGSELGLLDSGLNNVVTRYLGILRGIRHHLAQGMVRLQDDLEELDGSNVWFKGTKIAKREKLLQDTIGYFDVIKKTLEKYEGYIHPREDSG
ncbi:hypothetical protein ACFLZ6_01250 [Nanoarchaeota archaeon]